jgi:hypothetical protein
MPWAWRWLATAIGAEPWCAISPIWTVPGSFSIGAGAVVTRDVAPGAVVIDVPARIVERQSGGWIRKPGVAAIKARSYKAIAGRNSRRANRVQ